MNVRRWETFGIAIAVMAVVAFYAWNVDARGGLTLATGAQKKYDYYNHLVRGLLHGHLYLDVEVPEALKALPDPYDPEANRAVSLIDTSYYRGHYYLYFGAAPAVTLMLPYRILTGRELPTGWAILIFTTIGFGTMTALWLAVRRRYFPLSRPWMGGLGVVMLGTGCLVGAVLRRPFFWELAVAGGFAFAMLTLAALYAAIHRERGRVWWMAMAGLALGLAVASRPTYVFGAPVLLVPLMASWRARGLTREWWRMGAAAAVTLGGMALLIMAYNYGRFNNPFEFGHNYQLSVAYESKVRQFSASYIRYNLRLYYGLPAQWSWQLPFMAPALTPRAEMPAGFYTVDQVFGVLTVFPFAVLAALAPWALAGRTGREREQLGTTLAVLAASWITVGGAMLAFVAAVARYMVDFAPPLMLLAAIGMLAVERRVRGGWKRRCSDGLIAAVAVVTITGAALANFETGKLLLQTAPTLSRELNLAMSRVQLAVEWMRGVRYGPIDIEFRVPARPLAAEGTILQVGEEGVGAKVMVDCRRPGVVRIGLEQGSDTVEWSTAVPVRAGEWHRLRVDLGALYPMPLHPYFTGWDARVASGLAYRCEIVLDEEPVWHGVRTFDPRGRGEWRVTRREFSGEISRVTQREPLPGDAPSRGPKLLNLRFVGPADGAVRHWPLVTTGVRERGDAVVLELLGRRTARLVYDHWGQPPSVSEAFAVEPGKSQEFEVAPALDAWAMSADGARRLQVWLNQRLVWDTTEKAYATAVDRVKIGRNLSGFSSCEAAFPGLTASAPRPWSQSPGGVLHVRAILPVGRNNHAEPLVSTGHPGEADLVAIEFIDDGSVRCLLDHGGAPLQAGLPFAVDLREPHDFEIELPSFSAEAFGQARAGSVVVRCDGREAMRVASQAAAFKTDEWAVGRNQAHSTIADPTFSGLVIESGWGAGETK